MTEETRIESHKKAHDPEEHKKIEAIRAVETIQDGIRQAEQRLADGQHELADLMRQNAYDDFNAAVANGYLTPEAATAFQGKFEQIYKQIHETEAA